MWRRKTVECLVSFLLLTGLSIALIMSFYILKIYCERLMGALSTNPTKPNDMQRQCVLRILFILLFPKLTVDNLVFVTGFSSVVGSAPSGDGSHDA